MKIMIQNTADEMKKKLYFGGPILTMDRTCPRAEAVLTDGGKIIAVGDYKDLKTADAELIDLRGRTLMPAFVDGHSHAIGMGIQLTKNCDLSECTDFDDLLDRIRRYREEKDLTHGEAISCRGYDPAVMKEGRHPTAALLDSLGFDNPISCIHRSGHVAVYNSVAMERAGIDESYVCPEGGFAQRDADGRLTGYFEESAKKAFSPVFDRDLSDAGGAGALYLPRLYHRSGGQRQQATEDRLPGAPRCGGKA